MRRAQAFTRWGAIGCSAALRGSFIALGGAVNELAQARQRIDRVEIGTMLGEACLELRPDRQQIASDLDELRHLLGPLEVARLHCLSPALHSFNERCRGSLHGTLGGSASWLDRQGIVPDQFA